MRDRSPRPLEPTVEQMRELVERVTERVLAHIETLPQQPSADTSGALDVSRSLIEGIPWEGGDLERILALLFDSAIPKSFNAAGPGYLAYIPGGGLFASAVADFIGDAVNRYTGVFAAAPALVQLETNVLRWFCELVGYPPEALGILTTGGSLAALSAIVAARSEKLPDDFLRGTIYVTDQAHHSIEKAAAFAGFPAANVRFVARDGRYRMDLGDLARRIAADRADGMQPFLVVGSAGTTNTGAVDDLESIAGIAEREELWFHVDAAYGGFFVMTERGRNVLRGIERADSVTLDPHKALFLPYGTGCLLVKNRETLYRASSAHYLPEMQRDPDFVDFSEISPELSRAYRGLRAWLPIKLYGMSAFRDALDEKLDLTHVATERLRALDGVEIIDEPQLSIVAFRLDREGVPVEQLNEINQRWIELINARKRVMLTGTMIDGVFVLRICVVSFRTHRDRIEMALEDIESTLKEL